VEQTAAFLQDRGVRARPYHAGLDDGERARNQEAFQKDDVDVIVATVAFGMGIDKSNVRFVIHRDMPKDVESWYQEIGRAGRDGLESDCVLFYSWADVKMHERFLSDIEDPEVWREKRQGTVNLFELVEAERCRHQAIVAHFGEAMAPCEASCDVCTGVTVAERAAAAMVGQSGTGLRRRPRRSAASTPSSALPVGDDDEAAFQSLRALRKELADREGVPAYIVFSDKVLREMVALRPSSPGQLLEVSGVGPAKLERYGAVFLEALAGL
jgi:ATP-dependent DNA helicase RecQ